jgi:hypothetical protein
MPGYERWRRRLIDAANARGQILIIPSSQIVMRRIGSWPRALARAGLISASEALLARQRGPRKLTDDEILDCLVLALSQVGRPRRVSGDEGARGADSETTAAELPAGGRAGLAARELVRAEYRRWRLEHLRADDYPGPRLVSDMLICERFGDWASALRLANERLAKQGHTDG